MSAADTLHAPERPFLVHIPQLVDPAGVVAARVTASGDQFTTTSGVYREPSLSFGFADQPGLDHRPFLIERHLARHGEQRR